MTEATQDAQRQNSTLRWLVVAVLLVAGFLGAYKITTALTGKSGAPAAVATQVTPQAVAPTAPAPARTPISSAGAPAPTAPAAGTPAQTPPATNGGEGNCFIGSSPPAKTGD